MNCLFVFIWEKWNKENEKSVGCNNHYSNPMYATAWKWISLSYDTQNFKQRRDSSNVELKLNKTGFMTAAMIMLYAAYWTMLSKHYQMLANASRHRRTKEHDDFVLFCFLCSSTKFVSRSTKVWLPFLGGGYKSLS